eukprot:TRINITY_DN1751_c0_g1_i5.p2 TRINITY_DN1751_c0_g1~~TRINITY_DN1751_c0_g1_i5.p2  ORF type:complete len:239 (+),score=41.93 TRINITY_DN1751_c0_g1_i5:1096-1812(+)
MIQAQIHDPTSKQTFVINYPLSHVTLPTVPGEEPQNSCNNYIKRTDKLISTIKASKPADLDALIHKIEEHWKNPGPDCIKQSDNKYCSTHIKFISKIKAQTPKEKEDVVPTLVYTLDAYKKTCLQGGNSTRITMREPLTGYKCAEVFTFLHKNNQIFLEGQRRPYQHYRSLLDLLDHPANCFYSTPKCKYLSESTKDMDSNAEDFIGINYFNFLVNECALNKQMKNIHIYSKVCILKF